MKLPTGKKEKTDTEIRRRNAEAKRRGAFRAIETTNKNKAAETYYRKAIDKEIRRFLDRLFFELSRVYTTVSVENVAVKNGCVP